MIYEVAREDVCLPTGKELNEAIKGNGAKFTASDSIIKTITFGYTKDYVTAVSGVEAETVSTDDEIYIYRLNNGANVYILSPNNMVANEVSEYIFAHLWSLTEINFDNFDASKGNIINLYNIFYKCYEIKSLDLHDWNTSNVTDMSYMFSDCINLISVDLSSFDTHNVTHIQCMFFRCSSLETIDVSSFDTSNVIYFQQMFSNCGSLKTIYSSSKFVTYRASRTDGMFYSCTKLQGGAGTAYNANHVDGTYARIDGGPNSSTPGYFTAK